MGTEPGGWTDGERRRNAVPELESAGARLVCMYLDRVPSAYADEIERDLQLPRNVLEPILTSLVERGALLERDGLYVLANEPTQ